MMAVYKSDIPWYNTDVAPLSLVLSKALGGFRQLLEDSFLDTSERELTL